MLRNVRRRDLFLVLVLVTFVGLWIGSNAGDLDPPGSPGSTMMTLQEVYDRLDGLALGAMGVPKSGQTGCWDAAGVSISCAGTGQDGEYQAGVSVTPRFTDNGDGTVRDNLTGLIWLKDANCFGSRIWIDALADANTLASGSCGLTDGSMAGDWRLPNVMEMVSLLDYGNWGQPLPLPRPFINLASIFYWTSTTNAGPPNKHLAWNVSLGDGRVYGNTPKLEGHHVWPIRGGS